MLYFGIDLYFKSAFFCMAISHIAVAKIKQGNPVLLLPPILLLSECLQNNPSGAAGAVNKGLNFMLRGEA